MDWTQIFEDDGVDNVPELLLSRSNRSGNSGYSSIVAYCFSVNYIFGVGVLGVPYAFYQAGITLSSITMTLAAIITCITLAWMTEVCSYAEVINKVSTEHQSLLSPRYLVQKVNWVPVPSYNITHKLEVVSLCSIFLGKPGVAAYQTSLLFLMYTGLWAYCAVFVAAFTEAVPITSLEHSPDAQVAIYAAVFAVIVVPLSCMELTEQVGVQIALTISRLFTVALMAAACVAAVFADPYSGADNKGPPPYTAPSALGSNFGGFGLIFTTSIFTFLCQHSVPGLVFPIRKKRQAMAVLTSAMATVWLICIVLGVVGALYFGEDIASSINLNFTTFNYGVNPKHGLPLILKILNYIVVLFPTVASVSVFPLIGITLGNNLAYSIEGAGCLPKSLSPRAVVVVCRLIAVVPPISAAIFERNLSFILNISGFCGLYVALFTPCLLLFFSKRMVYKMFGDAKVSPYSTVFSHDGVIGSVFVFALGSVVVTVINFVATYTS